MSRRSNAWYRVVRLGMKVGGRLHPILKSVTTSMSVIIGSQVVAATGWATRDRWGGEGRWRGGGG